MASQPSPLPEPPGFSDLSKAEQIQYLQDLWDKISEDPDSLPVPEWHLRIVEERLAAYRRDPSRTRPAMEMLDDIARELP